MDPATIAGIISVIGGIFGQGQQNREIAAAEGGLNYWDQRINDLIAYLNSPGFMNSMTGDMNRQSDMALKDVMNRLGGGIVNPNGLIADWRDSTLQTDIAGEDQARQWIAQMTGGLEQNQASQYQSLLNTLMGQPSPLATGIMGAANSGMFDKLFSKKTSPTTTATTNAAQPMNDPIIPPGGLTNFQNPFPLPALPVSPMGYFGTPYGAATYGGPNTGPNWG